MWRVLICGACGEEQRPVGMFFDSTPGRRCGCCWSTLTKKEFKQMFGFAFSEGVSVQDHTTAFWAHSVGLSGNSQQRRKQRRAGLGVRTSMDRKHV